MKKKLIALVVVLLVAGGAAAYKLAGQKTDGIAATGTIEVTKADITPKVAGYLTDLTIQAGDRVTAGQTTAKIDRPDLTAQLLRDQAALEKAKAQLRDLESGAREAEVSEVRANLAAAQAVYDRAKADYARYQALFQSNAIAAQQLDSARSAYDVAHNTLVAAQSRLRLVEEGSRPEAVAAQRQEVERSQAVVAASQSLLRDSVIASPLSGLVLTKNYEQGEFVNAGAAIATIGDEDGCWVKVYIPSGQLGLIQVGQKAAIRVDSFPNREFAGRIREISQNAEYNPRQSLTQRERTNMVFAVKVAVDNGDKLLKPGMPADVVLK